MDGSTSTAAMSSSIDEVGEGSESLDSFESMCMASLFSRELSGPTASLLGTGMRAVWRLAENKEFDFEVVSFKQDDDDAFGAREVAVGAGVALGAGVELVDVD